MEAFRNVTGAAAPLLMDDINTDQIIPSAWLRRMDADLAEGLFAYMRRNPDGSPNAEFVLERPQFRSARILVVGKNFGCGSSREHAAWAMAAFGIRAVIAKSHADIFRENCLKNGILAITLPPDEMDDFVARVLTIDGREPFTVDLEAEEIRGPEGYTRAFAIAPFERVALLEGLDDIGLTGKHADAIAAWERRTTRDRPFLQRFSLAQRGVAEP
jgi:3-isopropylmalate/(R)-2-methylmalate dehydratase small subunit